MNRPQLGPRAAEEPVPPGTPPARASDRRVAWILGVCATIVALWQVLAALSARPFAQFRLTSEDFKSFAIRAPGWSAHPLPVRADPIEPNIVAFELNLPQSSPDRSVLVRLVHGYNMCDCMRIKGYSVEPLADTRATATEPRRPDGSDLPPNLQVWAVTSSTGDRTLWVTTMLRAADFAPTGVDVRDMAFPRVGTPDAQGWNPTGLTLRSLRHPVRNLRLALRAKWNASRCDWLTFLRLRQPAWASDELLTLVSATRGVPVPEADTALALRQLVDAHLAAHAALQQWRRDDAMLDSGP